MTGVLVLVLIIAASLGVAIAALYAVCGKPLRGALMLGLAAIGLLIAAQLDSRFGALLAAFAFGAAR